MKRVINSVDVYMWCVVCGVWCVVCGVWCVVCGMWCVVCGMCVCVKDSEVWMRYFPPVPHPSPEGNVIGCTFVFVNLCLACVSYLAKAAVDT